MSQVLDPYQGQVVTEHIPMKKPEINWGDTVKWTIAVHGVSVDKVGRVVLVLSRNDITGPRRMANQRFPHHERMFQGWGIPGNAVRGYLVEVLAGDKKLIYMPNPASLVLMENTPLSNTDATVMLRRATYKDRQNPLKTHVVNMHRSVSRKPMEVFKMEDGKDYLYDANGCLRSLKRFLKKNPNSDVTKVMRSS